ncbi:HNH endonuclease family protein [Pseudomonas sp. S32]|uniref:HNH endonuclease family protein n=1 Tax=Pseudomonas sp. S32 TaxID=2767448 RepID=UPI0019144E1C|nr:HNH endonuclease family protein [Pseudomonas sp. S32]
MLNIQIANPLLLTALRLFKDKKLKDKQLREIISLIEKYHYIHTSISGLPSSGGIARMYAGHARELANAQDPNTRGRCIEDFKRKIKDKIPTKSVFASKFKLLNYSNTRQRDLIRYTLWKIDQTRCPALNIDRSSSSIEHLLPQSSKDLSAHSLGNLILIPIKFNGSTLDNKPFDEKRKLLNNNGYPVDIHIENAEVWNKEQIEYRLESLTDYAYDTVWAID